MKSALRVSTFELNDSNVTIQDFMSFKGSEKRKITNIDFQASNLIPTISAPITNFVL